MDRIVDRFFPQHPERWKTDFPVTENVPVFGVAELLLAALSLSNLKAPDPDRIPAEVVKSVTIKFPYLLLNMFNLFRWTRMIARSIKGSSFI